MPASKDGPPARGPGPFWVPIVAGLLHAILLIAAFPPVGFWPAALVAPLPLVWIVLRCPRGPLRLGLLVAAGALPLELYEHQWIWKVASLGFVPMAIILALFTGGFVWAGARVVRRFPAIPMTLLVPVLWTGVEVFRGEVFFTGYPWLLLAHPLIDAPLLPLTAGLIGAYGVSFLVSMLSGAAADAWRKRPLPAVVAIGVLAASIGLGAGLRPRDDPHGPRLEVAVVQTNIPQDNKNEWTPRQRLDDFQRFEVLTREAAADRPELIVWPETMFPGSALDPAAVGEQRSAAAKLKADPSITAFSDALCMLQSQVGIPLMVGAIAVDGLKITRDDRGLHAKYEALYNSAYLLRDGAVQPTRYDKIDLTPFGEVMPYIRHWPWLQHQVMALAAGGLTFDLSYGRQPVVFHLPSMTGGPDPAILTPICFEATKPAACRRLVVAAGDSPRLIANLTNDGWFAGFDPARWQHLQIARWRAIELNTPVIRAANTGVSAAINSAGRVLRAGPDAPGPRTQVDGVLTTDILLGVATTIYAQTGDVLGWSSLAATGALLAATFWKPKKEAA